ncbi:hypothetical protein GGX14DRAFT_569230 [Mycena pura]|uniref:Uncharacterized protein n=1 Tax=Mycena pura TaxID=153505 RepID=A0AAD6V7T3_9AGAR|nr:hypothetical protein GGX14DRAFT_569230 [Mycena pura]
MSAHAEQPRTATCAGAVVYTVQRDGQRPRCMWARVPLERSVHVGVPGACSMLVAVTLTIIRVQSLLAGGRRGGGEPEAGARGWERVRVVDRVVHADTAAGPWPWLEARDASESELLRRVRVLVSNRDLSSATLTSTLPPLTRALNSPPALCCGIRSPTAPLYGLGWRCAYGDILNRHPEGLGCLSSVKNVSVLPLWDETGNWDKFEGKIKFEPRFVYHSYNELAEGDYRDIVCFITFNTDADSLKGLLTSEGELTTDGKDFVEAAKTVLKIDSEEEGDTFMWYRCSPL